MQDVSPLRIRKELPLPQARASFGRAANSSTPDNPLSSESTLASLSLLRIGAQANDAGYLTRLIFHFTPTPQINEFRVKQRVMQGGHNIDTDTIRRRHALGLRYLPHYVDGCREAIVFDAQRARSREIFRKEDGRIAVAAAEEMKGLRQAVERAGGHPTF